MCSVHEVVLQVQTHCYEAVDLDDFVRVREFLLHVDMILIFTQLSNEFEFPVAAFHHAHETYLVPDVLKRAYGGEEFHFDIVSSR